MANFDTKPQYTRRVVRVNVNGTWHDLPVPAKDGLSYEIQTVVDAGRDATGTMIGNVVGTDKIKLNIKYPPLSDEDMRYIIGLFDKDGGGAYQVLANFYDPRRGYRVTKQMYVGDRSFKPYLVKSAADGVPYLWDDFECNLIEV